MSELAADELRRRIPGVRIVDVCDGFTGADDVARRVRASGADGVIVALGNPLLL